MVEKQRVRLMTAVQVLGKDRSTAGKDEGDGVGGAAGYVGAGVGGDAAQSVCLLSSCYRYFL